MVVCGSSAEVASSHSRMPGSLASARAMATRCFWPPESCAGYVSALSAISTSRSSFSTFSLTCIRERPLPLRANATLSKTVREGIRLKCWKIIPIFFRVARSSFADNLVRSCPSIRTLPESGRSSRLMHRTSVDFPAPEKPMMPKISPSATVMLTSLTAEISLSAVRNVLQTFISSIKPDTSSFSVKPIS